MGWQSPLGPILPALLQGHFAARGDLAVAETLFLRAISASPTYHEVAQKNLQEVERRKTIGTPVPAVFK